MSKKGWLRALIAFSAPPTVACSGADGPADFTVRDSLGIRIVEHTGISSLASDTLGSVPILSIGSVDGTESSAFHRIAGLLRFPDGTVFVADGGSQQIRAFSSSGDHMTSFGGRGQGPSEFTYIGQLFPIGSDSVAAADVMSNSVKVFDRSGNLLRTERLPEPEAGNDRAFLAGITGGGSLLLQSARSSGELDIGYRRDPVHVVLHDPSSGESRPVGIFPGTEVEVRQRGERLMMVPVTMGGGTLLAVRGDFVAITSTDVSDLLLYRDAELVQIVRLHGVRRSVDANVRAQLLKYQLSFAESDDERATIRAGFDETMFSDSMPAFSALVLDSSGRTWAQRYAPRYEVGPSAWWVIGLDGVIEAVISMPTGFSPKQVDEGVVLGVTRDELGVEYVQAYGISR